MRLRKSTTIRYKENDEVKTATVPQMNSTGREMQPPALSRHQIFTLPMKHPQLQWMDEVMKKRDCDIIRILNRIRPDMIEAAIAKAVHKGANAEELVAEAERAYDTAESVLEQFQQWAKDLPAERAKRIKTEYEAWIEFQFCIFMPICAVCSMCREPIVDGKWHDHPRE